MSWIALLLTPNVWACDWDDDDDAYVSADDDGDDDEDEDDGAPSASIASSEDAKRGSDVFLSYDMQFLPDIPGHHIGLRIVAPSDAYVSGEIRYTPGSDLVGTGRVGAGLDVFGGGNFDLTLGLWVGAAGEWDHTQHAEILYATPILGSEVGIGFEGRHLFAKYRWLAGFGGGPVDHLLTENELTFGYKIVPQVQVYGQYLVLSPGDLDNESGVGLGARVVF